MLFEQGVGKERKNEILSKQIQYEAIEPCLWSLGLIDQLSTYDSFVVKDFHPLLEIGKNHSFEKLLSQCRLRRVDEIDLQTEISMLWHWRARELSHIEFDLQPASEVIVSTFGNHYLKVLDEMKISHDHQTDFHVNKTSFAKLSSEEMNRTQLIAYWRHHAFEWILGKAEWDEVEVNT